MDDILSYLLDDLSALKACSRTCKSLFGATRPILHQRVCLASSSVQAGRPKAKGSLFSPRRGDFEAFERLVDADRSGTLRYIQHLTFKMGNSFPTPENMLKHHLHFQSMTNLHSLTLMPLHLFIPVFGERFDMFTDILRHRSTYEPHMAQIDNSCTLYPSFPCWKT